MSAYYKILNNVNFNNKKAILANEPGVRLYDSNIENSCDW